VRQPYDEASVNSYLAAMRLATSQVIATRKCDVDPREFGRRLSDAMPVWTQTRFFALQNIGAIWQRAGRFRAEREATGKILEIRSGRVPSAASQCSDGMWIVTPARIRFSKKIDGPIPLEY